MKKQNKQKNIPSPFKELLSKDRKDEELHMDSKHLKTALRRVSDVATGKKRGYIFVGEMVPDGIQAMGFAFRVPRMQMIQAVFNSLELQPTELIAYLFGGGEWDDKNKHWGKVSE